MSAPICSVENSDEALGVVRRHQDFVEVFRLMQDQLGLTNSFIDDVGGLVSGHTDKILGPSQTRNWGPTTFDLFCEIFAIEFRAHIDLDAAKRMADLWEKRRRPAALSHTNRISKKLLEKAKPLVAQAMGRAGAAKKMTMLSAEHRSKVARKAAKSRWRKYQRQRRSKTLSQSSTP